MQHMFPLTSLSCQYICTCLFRLLSLHVQRQGACARVLTRVAAHTLEEESLLEPNIFSPLDIQEGGGGRRVRERSSEACAPAITDRKFANKQSLSSFGSSLIHRLKSCLFEIT